MRIETGTLFRKVLRDTLARPWRAAGLAVSIAFGTGLFGAIGMALQSIPHTMETFYDLTGFADLEVALLPEDAQNLPDFKDVPGVESAEFRLVFPGFAHREGKPRLPVVLILTADPAPRINAVHLKEGTGYAESDGNGFVIDRGMSRYQGFRVGDSLVLQVGEKTYRERISGMGVSPEFFAAIANPDFALPEKGSMGAVFGNLRRIEDALGFALVNDIVFRFAPGADPDSTRAGILAALQGQSIRKVVPRAEQFSRRRILLDVAQYRIYTWAIVFTLVASAAIIALMTFGRYASETRAHLGAFLGLGYPKTRLWTAVGQVGLLLGCAGGVLGIGAALLARNLFTGSYRESMGLPEVINRTDPAILVQGFLLSLLIGLAASLLPVVLLTRHPPVRVTRGQGTKSPFQSPWERGLARLADFRSPAFRFGIRNLIRSPLLTLGCAAALGFSLSVPIAYGICTTSSATSILSSLNGEDWDLALDYLHPIHEEDVDSLESRAGIGKAVRYFRGNADIGKDGRFVGVRILGKGAGESGSLGLSSDIASALGAGLGDTVQLRVGTALHRFRISRITSDFFIGQASMGYEAAQALCEFPGKATGAYLHVDSAFSPASLAGLEIAGATGRQELVDRLAKNWDESLGVVYICTAFTLVMCAVFLAMTMNLAILERKGDYAVLRSQGYGKAAILRMILVETGALFTLAALLSLPMAALLAALLNHRVSGIWFTVDFHHRLADYLLPLGVVFPFVPLVSVAAGREAMKGEIAAEIRARAIQ